MKASASWSASAANAITEALQLDGGANQIISGITANQCDIDADGVRVLCDGLRASKNITLLMFSMCTNVGDEVGAAIASQLAKSRCTELVVHMCWLGDDGAVKLAKAMPQCPTLDIVIFNSNIF